MIEQLLATIFSGWGLTALMVILSCVGVFLALIFVFNKQLKSNRAALLGAILIIGGVLGAYLLDINMITQNYHAVSWTILGILVTMVVMALVVPLNRLINK